MADSYDVTERAYRANIDGLRAISVIAVILYHTFPSALSGGFCGVDVFFVISGYLITPIIYNGLQYQRFSLLSFYGRRARRLLPALICVMTSVLYVGWLTLLPNELRRLGWHVVSGSVFISNITLANEAGYFDTNASTKPLLHLWSLGVEEPFYIIYPLSSIVFHRFFPAKIILFSIVLLVMSFIFSTLMEHFKPIFAFYSIHSRFWEIAIGGILALKTSRNNIFMKHDIVSSVSGAMLILCAFLFLSSDLPFPVPFALMPTLGAALIIAAGPRCFLNRAVLSALPMRLIGKISYPLYLWHWPLLSYARILRQDLLSFELKIAVLLTTAVLSLLTYYLIESPLRFGQWRNAKAAALCSMLTVVCLTGLFINHSNGFPERTAARTNVWEPYRAVDLVPFINHDCGLPKDEASLFGICASDVRDKVRYAIVGDSKADSLFPGLVATSLPSGRWLIIGGSGPNGAPIPVSSSNPRHLEFENLLQAAEHAIIGNHDVSHVVIAASANVLFNIDTDISEKEMGLTDSYLEEDVKQRLGSMVGVFVKAGRRVTLIVDNPTLAHPEDCTRRYIPTEFLRDIIRPDNTGCAIQLQRHLDLVNRYRRVLNDIKENFKPYVTLLDTTPYVCDMKAGICGHVKNGLELYSYSYHISRSVADSIGRDVNEYLSLHSPSTAVSGDEIRPKYSGQ